MDVLDLLRLFGGLALFLYGMNVMGSGLERTAGGRLERVLERLTRTPIMGVLLGAAVTAVIQSSSATTVMVVGFVNAGIMKLSQAIGIIMGANIGTTVTAWILSLTGLQGDSLLVQLCKPDSFSPILAVAGIVLIMFSKRGKLKDVGSILIGFAVLMFGMSAMSGAVEPLKHNEAFTQILMLFSNPVLGVIAGAALTAIIQSSSASVGILQALSTTGSITYGSAIPIIMGQNIGTCATALISCIGANKNAKRAAMVHLYFNIIGSVLFLAGFYALDAFLHFSFIGESLDPANIAVIHTLFNLLSTALLLPFAKWIGRLAEITVRDKQAKDAVTVLDERFLNAPAFALEQCRNLTDKMAALAKQTLCDAIRLTDHYDDKAAERVIVSENRLDEYEDRLGTYLVKLSSKELSEEDSREIAKLLHVIGDLERIGDHAVNIMQAAEEMKNKKIRFSDSAQAELAVMEQALNEILELTMRALNDNDLSLAARVEPLEQVIDGLKAELKLRHVRRLQKGTCTIELGFVLSDLLNNFERVSDHCSNIAVCLIQIREQAFDTHIYLNAIKQNDGLFQEAFEAYESKYRLPVSASATKPAAKS